MPQPAMDARGKAESHSVLDVGDRERLSLIGQWIGNAPVGIALVNASLQYVEVNHALAEAHERTIDEHFGRTVEEITPALWPILEPIYRRVFAGEVVLNQIIKEPTNRVRYWCASYFPVQMEGGVACVGTVASDVTDFVNEANALVIRKSLDGMLARTNEAATQCESPQQLLDTVCDIAVEAGEFPLAAVVLDDGTTSRIVAYSGTAEGLLDAPSDTSSSGGHVHVTAPRDKARGESKIAEGPLEFLRSVKSFDGALVHLDHGSSASFPLHESGREIGVLSLYSRDDAFFTDERVETLRNISLSVELALDRLAARRAFALEEEEARSNEQRARYLAAIVESSHDAIIGQTIEGYVTSWNRGAELMYGYRPDEVLGRHISVIVPNTRLHELDELLLRVKQGERIARHATQRIAKDGSTLDVSVSFSPVSDVSGQVLGVSSIASDISDLVRGELQQRELERHLVQLERLEGLGMLAGGVAHDFNNLLAVILNYSEFIADELEDAEAVRRDVGQIREAAHRAIALTRQLLTFARREVQHPTTIDLNTVIVQFEQLFQRTIGEHIELRKTLCEDCWSVKFDLSHLEQILTNVVLNARDAMPTGGTINIDTQNVYIDDDYAKTRPNLVPGRYVQIRITDTGSGMSREVMDRVFEPFFTTKQAGEGTGLGLPTAYGIVTQAGGSIELNSEVGVGTTCQLLFPTTEEPFIETADASIMRSLAGTESVLVVEDEDALRSVTKRILERNGYEVWTCASGLEAIEFARSHRGPIDLLLTDVVMPKMVGDEVATRIRALRPALPVLFMSGYAHPALKALVGLDIDLLEKPFTEVQLLEKVRGALSGLR